MKLAFVTVFFLSTQNLSVSMLIWKFFAVALKDSPKL